jgi:hypothetical protein
VSYTLASAECVALIGQFFGILPARPVPVLANAGDGVHDQQQRQDRARETAWKPKEAERSHRWIGEQSVELRVARLLLVEESIKAPRLGADVLRKEGGIEQLAEP